MIGRQPALTFERLVFENKVNNALRSVEKVLDIERHPRLAGDVEHSYQSKYDLVDTTSNAALIACMNVFDIMGLNSDILQSLDKKHATTLSFEASISCTLDKEVIVDVPKEMYFEETKSTKSSGIFGNSESKRVSTVRFVINITLSKLVRYVSLPLLFPHIGCAAHHRVSLQGRYPVANLRLLRQIHRKQTSYQFEIMPCQHNKPEQKHCTS